MTRKYLLENTTKVGKFILAGIEVIQDKSDGEAFFALVAKILPPGTGIKVGGNEFTSDIPKRHWIVSTRGPMECKCTDDKLLEVISSTGVENIEGIESCTPKFEHDIITADAIP